MQQADGNSMDDAPSNRLGAELPARFEEFRDFHAGASVLVCGLPDGVDFTYHHFWGETGRHPLDAETRQIEMRATGRET
jgi:hypothetical protein